jgi:hypothetical protein
MVNGSTIPVIAGLAVGIVLVALFSVMFKPDSMLTDEELVSKYSKIAEVRYFLDKYSDATAEVNRNPYDEYLTISFGVERQVDPPSYFYSGVHTLGIHLYTKPNHLSLAIYCGTNGMTGESGLSGIVMVDQVEEECFQTSYREQQFTVAASSVNGKNLGLRQATIVDPQVIAEYPLLQNMIAQVDKAGTKELDIFYRSIGNSEATFLTDERLAFAQTCLELVCYDELSTFINFGHETSYLIRIFVGDDPFGIRTDAETGVFVPDPSESELNGGVIVIEENDENTKIEIEYNEE